MNRSCSVSASMLSRPRRHLDASKHRETSIPLVQTLLHTHTHTDTHTHIHTHTHTHTHYIQTNATIYTVFHNLTHVHLDVLAHTDSHTSPPTHPKLAIMLNPSPAWVIPDNPRLILVNSGHSSAGFHPETTEAGWGLVGSWRLRVGAVLVDIIGRAVIGSQEKQAQVFTGLQNKSGLTSSTSHHSLTVVPAHGRKHVFHQSTVCLRVHALTRPWSFVWLLWEPGLRNRLNLFL